jgi:hypothetical protein
MMRFVDVNHLRHECQKLDIKVSVSTLGGAARLHIMDHEFTEYLPALHYVQAYQAEQGARWAAYKPKVTKAESEVRS